ncbi:hypothetical protein [Hamadaea tsunoensis]|uniref:hypothetical protein n=1 Tax=Hamadaea tsunoensis TaxID=53368 RepID=UPI0004186045|nr:hypothetical protein [Hamadaea tsunoensis]
MSDPLHERFESFRTASMARTRPPGVAAARRTIVRRQLTRAGVLALTAIGLALAIWLPPGGEGAIPATPSTPPAVSPSPAVVSASPSAAPSPSASRSPQDDRPPCSIAYAGTAGALLLQSTDPDTYALPAKVVSACPSISIQLTRAVYVGGTDQAPENLSRYRTVTRVLSAAHPTATLPAPARPDGTCYSALEVTVSGAGSLPAVLPNPIPELAGTGSQDGLNRYFANRGHGVLGVSWAEPSC